MTRYYVTCLNEETGARVFATHGWFLTQDTARAYAATVLALLRPVVIEQTRDFYQRYETAHVYIPENDFGVAEGFYDKKGLVRLLREYSTNPAAICFITDIME